MQAEAFIAKDLILYQALLRLRLCDATLDQEGMNLLPNKYFFLVILKGDLQKI